MPHSLLRDCALILTRELDAVVREVEAFPDDDALWRVVPGIANSAGNLTLHLSGNLQHFVGTLLGNTGYVRDRDAEFGRRAGTRAELVREVAQARSVVETVLPGLPGSALEASIAHPMLPGPVPAQRMLLHLCAHAGFHLGQIGYLRRVLTGENRSMNPLPVAPLVD